MYVLSEIICHAWGEYSFHGGWGIWAMKMQSTESQKYNSVILTKEIYKCGMYVTVIIDPRLTFSPRSFVDLDETVCFCLLMSWKITI